MRAQRDDARQLPNTNSLHIDRVILMLVAVRTGNVPDADRPPSHKAPPEPPIADTDVASRLVIVTDMINRIHSTEPSHAGPQVMLRATMLSCEREYGTGTARHGCTNRSFTKGNDNRGHAALTSDAEEEPKATVSSSAIMPFVKPATLEMTSKIRTRLMVMDSAVAIGAMADDTAIMDGLK